MSSGSIDESDNSGNSDDSNSDDTESCDSDDSEVRIRRRGKFIAIAFYCEHFILKIYFEHLNIFLGRKNRWVTRYIQVHGGTKPRKSKRIVASDATE